MPRDVSRLVLPLLWLGAFLFPSSSVSIFGGIPLRGFAEFAGLALLAPVLFSSALRKAVGELPLSVRIVAGAVAIAVIAMKVLLLAAPGEGGFVACYRSLVPPGDRQGCQRSFDDVLGTSGATKVDSRLSFSGLTWDLSFFNQADYNIKPVSGDYDRADLPFEATWTGTIDDSGPATVPIRYTGQVTVDDGTQTFTLPAQYGESTTANVTLAGGSHRLRVFYRFDDGHRVGGSPATNPVLDVPVAAANPLPWSAITFLVDALVAALLVLVALLYARVASRVERAIVAVALVMSPLLATVAFFPLHRNLVGLALPSVALLIALATLVWFEVRPIFLWLVSASGSACFALLIYGLKPGYGVLSWGNDPYTYQSFAHSILLTRSLAGGESVFYYQPFFRYVLFVQDVVFGDGWALVFAVAMTAIWCLALVLTASLRDSLSPLVFLGLGGLFLLTIIAQAVPYNVYSGLSEYPAWICLLLAAVLVLTVGPPWRLLPAAILLATAVIIRPEILPGAVAMLAVGAWRTGATRYWLALSIASFLAVGALPLLHNLYFGHTIALFTTPQGRANSVEFGLADMLARPGSTVGRHLIMLFDFLTTGNRVLDLAIHASQLLWAAAVFLAVRRRRWDALAILSLPVAFALPFIVVQVEVYYPRHIMATYMVTWLSLMVAASMLLRPQPIPELQMRFLRLARVTVAPGHTN